MIGRHQCRRAGAILQERVEVVRRRWLSHSQRRVQRSLFPHPHHHYPDDRGDVNPWFSPVSCAPSSVANTSYSAEPGVTSRLLLRRLLRSNVDADDAEPQLVQRLPKNATVGLTSSTCLSTVALSAPPAPRCRSHAPPNRDTGAPLKRRARTAIWRIGVRSVVELMTMRLTLIGPKSRPRADRARALRVGCQHWR